MARLSPMPLRLSQWNHAFAEAAGTVAVLTVVIAVVNLLRLQPSPWQLPLIRHPPKLLVRIWSPTR